MLHVRLLGQFELYYDGARLTIPTRNGQSLLAYLILSAGRFHRRERLAGLLWPDSADDSARSNLRHELWRLRKALDTTGTDYLLVEDLSLAFDATRDYSLDVRTLESIRPDSSSIEDLIAAVSVYQGDLLPGFYDEWVLSERERLLGAYETRLGRLLELLEAERRWSEMQDWAKRWIALNGWPEPAYRALMVSYAMTGDLPRALSTYERLRLGLDSELAIQPSEQTQVLYEQLRTGRLPMDPPQPVPENQLVKTKMDVGALGLPSAFNNLPRPLTSFVGRKSEVSQVKVLVDKARLVTIVGAGGVGKTRLAIEVGGGLTADFSDGVWWVELAPITEGGSTPTGSVKSGESGEDLIWQAIAKATQVTSSLGGSISADVIFQLRAGQRLLILDNCEHVITACAVITQQLLTSAPDLKILTTSREPLGVAGEKIWPLPSLSLPEPGGGAAASTIVEAEAVQLFLQRAADAQPDFMASDLDLATITQICAQLDGIPLAIELAAARLNLLTPTEIAARLDHRFSLLTAGQRTALPRHQTLRAAIEWSYDLLSEFEKLLFRRLSVFCGSFTLTAAEAICSGEALPTAEVLTLMGRLKDKSLLHIDPNFHFAVPGTRYQMLDTIRTFGQMMLDEAGETQPLRNRHAAYHTEFVESVAPKILLQEQLPWTRVLRLEYDNIRTAIEWSIESDQAEYGLRMVEALTWFWFSFLSMREGHDLALRILSLSSASDHQVYRAKMSNTLRFMQWFLNDRSTSVTELDRDLQILRAANDQAAVALGYQLRGLILGADGQYDLADQAMREGQELARQLDNYQTSSFALPFWGDVVLLRGDRNRAIEVYKECAAILASVGNQLFGAYPARRLGYLSLEEGDLVQSWHYFRESLNLNRKVGDRRAIFACFVSMAALALKVGKMDLAARLLGFVEQHMASLSNLLTLDQADFDRVQKDLLAVLEQPVLMTAFLEGRAMTDEQLDLLIASTFEDETVFALAHQPASD